MLALYIFVLLRLLYTGLCSTVFGINLLCAMCIYIYMCLFEFPCKFSLKLKEKGKFKSKKLKEKGIDLHLKSKFGETTILMICII